MALNITWSDGENTTFSNGDNAVWDLSGLISAVSVALRDIKSLTCGLSVAVRDWKSRKCSSSVTQRTSDEEEVFYIYATEDTIGTETYLGSTDSILTDVSLADGTWRIEARPSKNQWRGARYGQLITVVIASGLIVSTVSLPPVENLYANAKNAYGTDIFWTWTDGFGITEPTSFGLWFSATSPVDTSGAQDATVTARDAADLTAYRHDQSVQEYVAVRALDGSGNKGPQSEILLPIAGGSPTSPVYEWGDKTL